LPIKPRIKVIFQGSLLRDHYDDIALDYIYFYLTLEHPNGQSDNISLTYKLPIAEKSQLDNVKQIKRSKTIDLNESLFQNLNQNGSVLTLNMLHYLDEGNSLPLIISYDPTPLDKELGIIFAAIILLGLYVLIIWELVHRTFAAMVASTLAIGVLAAMNERPTMALIISWIDVETLLLLFGMMILVAVLSETGVFDYLAVYAFKVRKNFNNFKS
jgi:P protein